jgi:hypothetical protein
MSPIDSRSGLLSSWGYAHTEQNVWGNTRLLFVGVMMALRDTTENESTV